ncbi:hypothetical protein F3Y22_tig00111366pilonHSYRG00365 [Hibiscus syriacus]|uniref:Uncharacterized protein n=1 Tax=Hibiscus syriacus TaxID=106335 RepID=A0A6A2YNL8_HIBSY|nr:hypothetical protein F3Y22_tig00111366pilonHSYRG00365 [Hibiscus syriacus]
MVNCSSVVPLTHTLKASSLDGNGPLCSEVAGEWGGYSPTPVKLSVEEWDSDLVLESSLKQTSLGSDHAAIPSSGSGQLAHSSLTNPAENAAGWDSIIPDPNDPALNPGKRDALCSTKDLRMSSESTVTNETIEASDCEVLDAQKSSGRHSSTSSENDVSVNQYEAGSGMLLPAPAVTTWDMTAIDTTWRAGRESTTINWEAIQGNLSFNLGGTGQGARNFSWGAGQGTFQYNGSINLSTYWGSQQ